MLLMQVPSVVEQKATIFVANMCKKYQIIQKKASNENLENFTNN